MSERVLVTGGCGFVGSNLVKGLVQKGAEVVILDNLSRGNPEYLKEFDVEIIEADIRDKEGSALAFKNIDKVVHLAAYGNVVESVDDPTQNFEINVQGTFNVLLNAVENDVSRFVFSSTGGALIGNATPPVSETSLPKPISPYGAGKLCCEAYIHAFSQSYELNAYALRFANVYGPNCAHKTGVINHFFKRLRDDEPLVIYGDGTSSRDYIHVSDLCNGISLALFDEKGDHHNVFHLASGKETTLSELAEISMKAAGKPEHEILYKDKRVGEVDRNFANYDQARKVLGFEPKVDLLEGLRELWLSNSW